MDSKDLQKVHKEREGERRQHDVGGHGACREGCQADPPHIDDRTDLWDQRGHRERR